MDLDGKKVGIAISGSYCTFDKVFPHIKRLSELGCKLRIIFSERSFQTDTRFGSAATWREKFGKLSEEPIIHTIPGAEPIGPQGLLDLLLIAPCTGNTLAKLSRAITDSAVLMAAKSQLRNRRPVVLAVSTNDALSNNAKNLGLLLNTRNIYFVPMGQDDPVNKANSMVSKMDLIPETVCCALKDRQLQPIIVEYA